MLVSVKSDAHISTLVPGDCLHLHLVGGSSLVNVNVCLENR